MFAGRKVVFTFPARVKCLVLVLVIQVVYNMLNYRKWRIIFSKTCKLMFNNLKLVLVLGSLTMNQQSCRWFYTTKMSVADCNSVINYPTAFFLFQRARSS